MPCCTYFDKSDVQRHREACGDSEINELLDELNVAGKSHWFVRETTFTRRRYFWSKPEIVKRYTLYSETRAPEYQVINFAPESHGDWSINTMNTRTAVIAYMHGFLAGQHAMSSRS